MKTYKPNYKLYLLLLIGGLAISGISLAIQIDSKWFTVVAGVGCGAVASVIVAWLIDVANCKVQNDKLKEKRRELLGLLLASTTGFVDIFGQIYSVVCKQPEVKEERHTWIEWKNKLYDYICKPDFPQNNLQFVKKSLGQAAGNFVRYVKEVESNRIYLMSMDLIDNDFYLLLFRLRDDLEANKDIVENDYVSDPIRFFMCFADSLYENIEGISSVREINHIAFRPYHNIELFSGLKK